MTWDTAAMQRQVGWRSQRRVDAVECRHARDYTRAVGLSGSDRLQLGDAVLPTIVACFLTEPPALPGVDKFGEHWLNGGDAFRFRGALRAGDRLQSATTLTAADLKHGRSGPLGVLTFVTEFEVPGSGAIVTHTGTRLRR
jgi:N-terminal half of MaoC dehydratase